MLNLYVGFSRARSNFAIGSRVIQETEKRQFSHAYIKYKDPTSGVIMVSQASHGYVNMVDYGIFKEHNIIVEEYLLECSDQEFKTVLTTMHKNCGKPYSRFQLLLIAIKKLLHFEVNIRNRDTAFICSEWAAWLCGKAGKPVPEDLDYETPSDLNKLVRDLGLVRCG